MKNIYIIASNLKLYYSHYLWAKRHGWNKEHLYLIKSSVKDDYMGFYTDDLNFALSSYLEECDFDLTKDNKKMGSVKFNFLFLEFKDLEDFFLKQTNLSIEASENIRKEVEGK